MSERGRARRGLGLLLAGDAVSITGTSMTTIAIPWFVLVTTGSAARAGSAAFVSLLPIVIAAIFGGAIVDRVGYRRSSVGCVEFERIPERMRARVMGAGDAGAYAGMPVGGLLAGGLTGAIGLTATMLTFAGIYLTVCLPPFVGKVWRGLDTELD